jgi:hypothetical protein
LRFPIASGGDDWSDEIGFARRLSRQGELLEGNA